MPVKTLSLVSQGGLEALMRRKHVVSIHFVALALEQCRQVWDTYWTHATVLRYLLFFCVVCRQQVLYSSGSYQ